MVAFAKKHTATILVFALLCYFPIFLHLGELSVRMWDEARPAVSAFEMAMSGHSLKNYLVLHFDGEPDNYYTKPPLLVVLQSLSMQVFGYNETALRLPVALAVYALAFLLLWFGHRVLGSLQVGFLAGLVLVTSGGFMDEHIARTGDVDGFLIFWVTLYAFSFYRFLHADSPRSRHRWMALFAVSILLAALTKGIAALLVIPGLFAYVLARGKLRSVISFWPLYIYGLLFLSLMLGYYLLREHYAPGYLEAVYQEEFGGRFLDVLAGHEYPWYYYLSNFVFNYNALDLPPRYVPWAYLLPLALVTGLISRGSLRTRDFSLFALLFMLCYMTVISYSGTKLHWYDGPIYPMAALVIALFLKEYIVAPLAAMFDGKNMKRTMYAVFVILVFAVPYMRIINKIYFPEDQWDRLQYGYYLRFMERKMPETRQFTVTDYAYNGHLTFYVAVYNRTKGYSIKHDNSSGPHRTFEDGEIVITCMHNRMPEIESQYETELLAANAECRTYRIVRKK